MALFVNRWSQPIHIYEAPPEIPDIKSTGKAASYEVCEDASPTAFCDMPLRDANNQNKRRDGGEERALLRVSEMQCWDGLADMVADGRLCHDCLDRLPDRWPPAREIMDDGGFGTDSAVPDLEDLAR